VLRLSGATLRATSVMFWILKKSGIWVLIPAVHEENLNLGLLNLSSLICKRRRVDYVAYIPFVVS
jgi:hypothetical protein